MVFKMGKNCRKKNMGIKYKLKLKDLKLEYLIEYLNHS